MQNFKIEYDYIKLKLNNFNEYLKLLYRVRIYELLKNQDENYIKELKSKKYSLRLLNDKYYILTSICVIPLDKKKEYINEILHTFDKAGRKLYKKILYKWSKRNYHKNIDHNLMDKESIILDILSSFYLAGIEGENILNHRQWSKVKEYEVARFSDDIIKSNNKTKWEINESDNSYKKSTQKWKDSKTYKLNCLYLKNKKSYIINPNKKHIAKWCYVDTLNIFYFDNYKYQISEKVKQYKVKKDNQCEMDQILCFKQDNKEYFFDMNIEKIKNKYIHKIKPVNNN